MKGENVPSSGGHVILQHWSNGNQLWSGGPPASDAAIVVKSVKAYFNSSDAKKRGDWHNTCRGHGEMGTAGNHETGEESGGHGSHLAKSLTTALAPMMAVYTLVMMGPELEFGLKVWWE
ncbi:hypothetical protein VCV18_010131 [Metarhizium anisopliae]